MFSKPKNTTDSVDKLKEVSSTSIPPSSLSSPAAPPPPPPSPLPSPRPPSLTKSIAGASWFWGKKQYGKKPQLEPKPSLKASPGPLPPQSPLPQLPTLTPKPGITVPPRVTPTPFRGNQLGSGVSKKFSNGPVFFRGKRMKINDDQAEDDEKDEDDDDDKPRPEEMETETDHLGALNNKIGQDGNNMDIPSDRILLKARHGGGGFKPQGDCSQPSIHTYRPVPISSAAPSDAIRPSFSKSCTVTSASISQPALNVATGETNFLSTNSQDSNSKCVANGSPQKGQHVTQCVPVPAVLPVNQKVKSCYVSAGTSSMASILMPPPPPSKNPMGQKALVNAALKRCFLTEQKYLLVQQQITMIKTACMILRRAEQIRTMTNPARRALIGNVLNSIYDPQQGYRLNIGPGTYIIVRHQERREPTPAELIQEQDAKDKKPDEKPE